MMKIPSWRRFAEHRVTAYQDDTQFWRYYLIPDYVSIRRENGKPVFQVVAYTFGDQDREENPDLPRGGGYLAMDTELTVKPTSIGPITEQLQKDTNELWNQLKALAEAGGQPVTGAGLSSSAHLPDLDAGISLGVGDVLLGLAPEHPAAPPGDAPPQVVLADPAWVDGTFKVSAPQSPNLVANRVTEGKLSLLGGNVAAANMDLTAAGAAFMVGTLTDPDGGGAADTTPIQVTYDLTFLARVPPVSIDVSADSRNLYAGIKGVFHQYEGHGCDDDVVSHSEQELEMAVSSGLITVRVDKGDADLPDDVVTQMRSEALKTVTGMMKDRFLMKKPRPAEPEDDGTDDLLDRDSDVYFLKSEMSIDFAHFGYSERLATVRKWPARPQGTLQAFLEGLSPEETAEFVRRVSLDDPFFRSLSLDVTVEGIAWDTDPVDFVQVELHYEGTDPATGAAVPKSHAMTFTKADQKESWDPLLIGGKKEYSYRYRIGYRGHGPSEFTEWTETATDHLVIAVTAPGKVAIAFHAGDIDFGGLVQQVQLEVAYADPAQGVVEDGTTLALDGAGGSATWERWVFVPVTQPVRYRPRFFLTNDQQVVGEWTETVLDAVFVNEPVSDRRLDIRLFPAGRGWADVVQSVVALRYADPDHGLAVDGVQRLSSLEEFATWSLWLANPAKRDVEYKVLTSYRTGASDQTDWTRVEGDEILKITARELPALDVNLRPLVDFTVTPVVEVDLRYTSAGVSQHDTLALTGPEPQVWSVPIDPGAPEVFTHRITYNRADGEVVVLDPVTGEDDEIVIHKLAVPEVGCLFVARTVDFTATPVVEVTIDYADPARGVSETETLLFTDPGQQQWRLTTAPGAPETYTLTITYFLADGTVVTRDPVTTNKPKLNVPRFVPA